MKLAYLNVLKTCALACILAVGLSGCGGGGGSSSAVKVASTPGHASFKIKWPKKTRVIPMSAQCIVINLQSQFTPVETQTSGPIANPADGSTITWTSPQLDVGVWNVTSTAYPNADGSGTPLATATVPVTISSSQTSSVSLTMLSTATQIAINGPSTLAVNTTGTFTATVYDAANDVLLEDPSKISWTTSDPTLLSLSALTGSSVTGTSGTNAGAVNLTATFGEVEAGQTAPTVTFPVQISKSIVKSSLFAWTEFNGDARNTGRSSQKLTALHQEWRIPFSPHMGVQGSPIIDNNGIIYCVNHDGNLAAVNTNSQLVVWTTPVTSNLLALSPDQLTVYVNGTQGLQAFSAATGIAQWTLASTAGSQVSYPMFGPDGDLYVCTNKKVFKVDPTSHTIVGTFTCIGNAGNSVAIDTDGTLYVGDNTGRLYSIVSSDMTTVNWVFQNNLGGGEAFLGGPMIGDDGMIYIGSTNVFFHAIFKLSGAEKWNFNTGNNTPPHFFVEPAALSADGKTVVVGTNESDVYGVDAQSGNINWHVTTPGHITGRPVALADGNFLMTAIPDGTQMNTPSEVIAYSGTGTVVGAFGTLGGISEVAAPGSDRIIVTDYINSLYSLK